MFNLIFPILSSCSAYSIEYSRTGRSSKIVLIENEDYRELKEDYDGFFRGLISSKEELKEIIYSYFDPSLIEMTVVKTKRGIVKYKFFEPLKITKYSSSISVENGVVTLIDDRSNKEALKLSKYNVLDNNKGEFRNAEDNVLMTIEFEKTDSIILDKEKFFAIKATLRLKNSETEFLKHEYYIYDKADEANWEDILPGKDGFKTPNQIILSYSKDSEVSNSINPLSEILIEYSDITATLYNKDHKKVSKLPVNRNVDDKDFFNFSAEEKMIINTFKNYPTFIDLIKFLK